MNYNFCFPMIFFIKCQVLYIEYFKIFNKKAFFILLIEKIFILDKFKSKVNFNFGPEVQRLIQKKFTNIMKK